MYGLVPYNISDIQKGIQHGHGVVEYMMKHMNKPETQYWANNDKTFIILNGGTTNMGYQGDSKGTLNQYLDELIVNNIDYAKFHEPDLGDQLTSVNFLVDERVWDKEKYPDRDFGGPLVNGDMVLTVYRTPETEEHYIERLGGKKNVFLRDFLSKLRLA
jgi:hypothetical protein